MQINHRQRLALIWLLLSGLMAYFLFVASHTILKGDVHEQVRRHLLLTLDESHFGNAQRGGNDQEALQRIGQQMNTALEDFVINSWYSPLNECVVRLRRIDDVTISDEPMQTNISLSVPRNQIEREIVVGLSCSPNWLVTIAMSGLLGALFLLINHFLPAPLSRAHRQWINYLLERGYSGTEAFDIVHRCQASSLAMSPSQLACLEQLHDSERHNFATALQVVTDDRVAILDDSEVDWFLLGLRGDPGQITGALELASATDSVEIDLHQMTLTIRGLSVHISGTPLFYYAWYAMRRVSGDGWITNPASNRPDLVLGQELVDLMSRFDGHAKAINDLERTGLKAKTLDQNRSKIKDELVATLGEKLARAYLFEASKHPDGLHTRYRLPLDPRHIRVFPDPEKL